MAIYKQMTRAKSDYDPEEEVDPNYIMKTDGTSLGGVYSNHIVIPIYDERNIDTLAYKEWVDAGNTPDPPS